MVDVADRILGADHVHHGGIDASAFHLPGALFIGQSGVDGDLQMGKVALQALDHQIVTLILDLVDPVRSA